MDYLYYIFGTLIFIAVVLLVEGVYLGWNSTRGPEAERITRRLRMMSAGSHGQAGSSMIKRRLLSESPPLQRLLLSLPRVHQLDRMLEQSGLNWSVAKLLGIMGCCAAVALTALTWLGTPLLLALPGGAGGALLPLQYVLYRKRTRLQQIDLQLPDALDLMGRALRAGHAFPSALSMVGNEMRDPLAGEFATAFDEVNFGISMQDALMNLATRVPSTDLRYFVIAVTIQRETGGNLTELLDNISTIIRERIKLMGQVRVLSAEGRMSGWVLALLPVGAGMMMRVSNPEFLDVLFTDPDGRKMLGFACIMMLIGFFVMRRIVRIRV
jgi:tight adherence protein B